MATPDVMRRKCAATRHKDILSLQKFSDNVSNARTRIIRPQNDSGGVIAHVRDVLRQRHFHWKSITLRLSMFRQIKAPFSSLIPSLSFNYKLSGARGVGTEAEAASKDGEGEANDRVL